MRPFVVIDTNVIVAAMLSSNPDSPVRIVMDWLSEGVFEAIYSKEMFDEYAKVLHRKKFSFSEEDIAAALDNIQRNGMELTPEKIDASGLPDPKDAPFLEVSLSVDGSFLVTGNLKHFPVSPRIVSPRELIGILSGRF